MADLQTLSIDLIRTDAGTQTRLAIDDATVEEYAEKIGDGPEWTFPALDVFHDGVDYYLADGFHRYLAGKRQKRGSFPCRVHEGTPRDAKIYGMTANDNHGLRPNRADKRACVEWLLDNAPEMTQTSVAQTAGVTARTVRTIIAEQRTPEPPPDHPDHEDISKIRKTSGSDKGNRLSSKYPSRKGVAADDQDPPTHGEDGRSDSDGHDARMEQDPGPPGNGTEKSGVTEKDDAGVQRLKAIKTVEAGMREFDALNNLEPSTKHPYAIELLKRLLAFVKEWP